MASTAARDLDLATVSAASLGAHGATLFPRNRATRRCARRGRGPPRGRRRLRSQSARSSGSRLSRSGDSSPRLSLLSRACLALASLRRRTEGQRRGLGKGASTRGSAEGKAARPALCRTGTAARCLSAPFAYRCGSVRPPPPLRQRRISSFRPDMRCGPEGLRRQTGGVRGGHGRARAHGQLGFVAPSSASAVRLRGLFGEGHPAGALLRSGLLR